MSRKYMIIKYPNEIRGNEELFATWEEHLKNESDRFFAAAYMYGKTDKQIDPVQAIRDGEQGIVLRDQDMFSPYALKRYALQAAAAGGIDMQLLSDFMSYLATKWEQHPNRKTPD